MADLASKPWQIIQTLATQLAGIRRDAGYLTDIGQSVWMEAAQRPSDDAVGLTIYSRSITRMQGERPNKRGRIFEFAIEAALPCTQDDAHLQAHDLIEDIERAIAAYQTEAVAQTLPIELGDIAILDRPEGLPVIAVQAQFSARYWR